MEFTNQVESIDNEGVSLEKSRAAYEGNMRNWGVAFRGPVVICYNVVKQKQTDNA